MSHDSVCFVTGATGFIGSHLVDRLLSEGLTVVALTSGETNRWRLPPSHEGLTVRTADLANNAAMDSLFSEFAPGTVFHLAASGVRADAAQKDTAFTVNVAATLNLARTAARHNVNRFVYVGSGFELRPQAVPLNEQASLGSANYYGATKAAATVFLEYMERSEGLPLIVCRPFSVYGTREDATRFVPFIVQKALRGEPMELTLGTQVRDYLFVSDLVDGLFRAKNAPVGSVFHFGAGPQGACSVRMVVETVLRLTGFDPSLALWGKRTAPRPEPQYFVADSAAAQMRLGWLAKVSLNDGLAQTIEYYRDLATKSSD